ncbi:hypothetical protein [Halohasta litorea]|uniref:DUF4878 domain-containing protein n=1 Tax=Halohasta litorea TaxID=869891 RepID=A0ABD6DB55_9EURY|nr:hypothetical protein [Halohasta litorea]
MRRRELLSTSVIVIGGLSGCLNRIPLIGMTPEEVVTEFYEAQFALDVETANSHIHPESQIREITAQDAKRTQINEHSLISVTNTGAELEEEEFFLNESEVAEELEDLREYQDGTEGENVVIQEEIERYENGTTPQVATVSGMAEVEVVLDLIENGRRRRPTRTVVLIKDGNGWKIWTISSE